MARRILPLKFEEYFWGRIYNGDREQLIGAGIVEAGQFPGEPGNARVSQRFNDEPGALHIVRRSSRRRFDAWVNYTEAETQAYADRRREEEERGRREYEAINRAEEVAAALAKPDGLREMADDYARMGIGALRIAFNLKKSEPWQFSPATQAQAAKLIDGIKELFECSRIEPQPAAVAKANPKFQAMLAGLQKTGEARP